MFDQHLQRENPIWHIRLELCVADEHDSRLNGGGGQEIEEGLNSLNVAEVLANWVLKAVLVMERDLSPRVMFGIPKNPTAVVLGLDHKHPKTGHQNVVNLSCAASVL